ncbi:hypothetical protein BX666DRAFT_357937 [Dichotomocladium elegans]|nr:hypothetical protein BX666DRAFT_357937 [Dichotomocladium elegans]
MQEIQKSKEVENQLVSIKNAVSDANATLNDDQLAKADAQIAELQQKLEDTQGQLGSYKEKSRQQGQAIASASQELRRLQKTIRDLEEMNMHVKNNSNQSNEDATAEQESEVERWKTIAEEQRISLTKNLMEEKERSLAYESRCLVLEKRISQLQVEQDHVNKGQPTIEAIVQTRSVQLLLAIIIGLISTLIYVFAAV